MNWFKRFFCLHSDKIVLGKRLYWKCEKCQRLHHNPPWLKGRESGALYIDTSHPDWKEYFVWFIKKWGRHDSLVPPPVGSNLEVGKEETEKESQESMLAEIGQLYYNAVERGDGEVSHILKDFEIRRKNPTV
jgi:hypothetical protein